VDYQAKIRGFRIELGEIEAVLRQHTAVSQVIVSVWQKPGSSVKNLVAYLVTASDATLDTAELRQFLRSRLPEYMIPAALVFLAEFPLTPNGKINRRALPAPDMAFTEREENYVAPQSETEYGLAEIWGDVLNQDRIGIYDSFFELGGHSLLAIRIVSRIRKQFDVDLPLRAFFEDPTVAGLARHIENLQWATRSFTALDDALAVGDGFEEFTL
jgi:acyl carrier protein